MDNKKEEEKKKKEEKKKVLHKIREIVKLTSGGECIYRGQSDAAYSNVASSLYRALHHELKERRPKRKGKKLQEWKKLLDMEHDMNLVQEETLAAARKVTTEGYDDEGMLSRIQHYSGDTNLMDFTKDYLVALFFACNQKYGKKKDGGKNGEVFLLKTADLKDSDTEIITPVHPFNLVTAQKSIFVQSRKGFILKGDMGVVSIDTDLKLPILDYLKEHHNISLSTIYNDLHGYIRNRKEHGGAIMDLYLGISYDDKGDNEKSLDEKSEAVKKAMRYFKKAINLDPKYARAYNNLGNAKMKRGFINQLKNIQGYRRNYKDAIEDYKKAIKLDPKSAVAYNNRGVVNDQLGDVPGAIRDYDKAIELDPKYVEAYNNRGSAKVDCGNANRKLGDVPSAIIDYKDAIRDYDKAIELDPKYVKAYNNRGLAKVDCGDVKKESSAIIDYKDAIRDYDKTIELDSKHVEAYNNRGNAKVNCGDIKKESGDGSGAIIYYKDAIRDYDKAIKLDSEHAEAYNNRGNAKVDCGDIKKKSRSAIIYYKDAIKDYDKAINLEPKDLDVYFNRGFVKEKLGDMAGAIRDYNKVIELDSKYVIAYYNRGLAKQNCGDIKKESDGSGAIIYYKGAIKDYDKAIALDPKYVNVYNNRGLAKMDCGDIKKEPRSAIIYYKNAIKDYDKAIDLAPNGIETHYNRGLARERLGDKQNLQQALSDFEKAKELALQQDNQSMEGWAKASIKRVTAKIAKIDKLGKS